MSSISEQQIGLTSMALYTKLLPRIFLWDHLQLSFSISSDKKSVKVKAEVLQTEKTLEIVGDLLVAADGCLSSIRGSFLPDLKLSDSGYCGWRGFLIFPGMRIQISFSALEKPTLS
ncbi:hypothetical protein PanWU01x14_170270 [Parasponia andersonii]|uniref:FAD/NAD(P)-binding domain containing protein n=1 Tax=Parasponia andersonii TaxID=3476 RepID=A0A2P5CA77_PARAD|nr:hypothetical protein PanWU01x14_170270 [Parasponia andersonii]